MYIACQSKILVRDCWLASTLCLMLLTHCEELGLWPIHVSMGTIVPMNTSSSGVWLGSLVGQASEWADSRCADYCHHFGGSNSHVVIQQWCQRTKFTAGVQPGDNGVQEMAWTSTTRWMRKTPINTNELKFGSQELKTFPCKPIMYPSRNRKVWLLGGKKLWKKKKNT